MLQRLRSFLSAALGRKRFEDVMSDEIRFHMECYVEELVRSGVPLEEAERRARLEFGGVEGVKEACRESRRLNLTDTLRRDFRSAWRTFLKNPAFTATVILTLALGIGCTISIFSVVYGVLLKPLPFPDSDRLVQITAAIPARNITTVLSAANFWDMHDMNQSFEEFGALHYESYSLTGSSEPERVDGARVSVGFFRALAVKPVAGRLFLPGEDAPGSATDRVLLGHRLWVRRFGASPSVVGSKILLDGKAYEVLGVLPPGTPWLDAADVYAPYLRRLDADRGSWEYIAIGRIKAGTSFETARADLERVAKDLEARYSVNKGIGVNVQRSDTWMASEQLRLTLWVLLAAVFLLLIIAGVNVTNLLLALASSRLRESAMRTALGATRGDLIRESLSQSMTLSITGAMLGWLLAVRLLDAFRSMDPGGIPRLAEVELNGYVAAFAIASALLVGFITGVVPALTGRIGDVGRAIREGQRGTVGDRRHERLRGALVCVEVALALVLMVGAGLLVRSLTSLMSVDRGFQTDRRLLATVSIPGAYPDQRREQIALDILTQIQNRPEVESAADISGRPLSSGSTGLGVVAADAPPTEAVPWATWRVVTKDYFKTLSLPLLSGRGFSEQDTLAKPWRAIISRRLAELLWPGQDPIGRTAILWKGQGDRHCEIIGVVGDMRERGLESAPTLAVYFPAYGALDGTTHQLIIHTRAEPNQFNSTLRSIVSGIDPTLPISNIQTLDQIVSNSVSARRFTMLLLFTFAVVALVLSLAGVYGIVTYSVTKRIPEVGVRLALGAKPRDVLSLMVRQGMRPVAVGILCGLFAVLWLSRFMTSLLFEIKAGDPLTYIAVLTGLALVAAAACYVPARRVLAVDPAIALRSE